MLGAPGLRPARSSKVLLIKKFQTQSSGHPFGDGWVSRHALVGKRMKVAGQGSRPDISARERNLVQTRPGPLNKEPWRGKVRP